MADARAIAAADWLVSISTEKNGGASSTVDNNYLCSHSLLLHVKRPKNQSHYKQQNHE